MGLRRVCNALLWVRACGKACDVSVGVDGSSDVGVLDLGSGGGADAGAAGGPAGGAATAAEAPALPGSVAGRVPGMAMRLRVDSRAERAVSCATTDARYAACALSSSARRSIFLGASFRSSARADATWVSREGGSRTRLVRFR